MLVKTFASAVQGVDAITITVEVNTGGALPEGKLSYNLVGLPDKAVQESMHRLEAALKNTGYELKRIKTIINLAPANIRKTGSFFDLPIAMAFLGASKQVSATNMDQFVMMGELALDGSLRPITGALPMAIQARKEKFRGIWRKDSRGMKEKFRGGSRKDLWVNRGKIQG